VIGVEPFLALAGLFLVAVALRIALDRTHPSRFGSAAFWFVLGLLALGGRFIPAEAAGWALVMLVLLAAGKRVRESKEGDGASDREASAARLGNRLLVPVLVVPIVAVAGGFVLDRFSIMGGPLVEAKALSQVALALGCILALGVALALTRAPPRTALDEGGRLLQLVGWTMLLPPMLAALGGVFAKTGAGDALASLVAAALPVQHLPVAVLVYAAGMTLFTALMGNAFAAFPLVTLAVGLPFLVKAHGASPAAVGVLGMLCGYCGTLVTPMAANFNLVPVGLLELHDDYAVIRAQAPFAAAIWGFNVLLLFFVVG
jgi:uncharacterized membrane protein